MSKSTNTPTTISLNDVLKTPENYEVIIEAYPPDNHNEMVSGYYIATIKEVYPGQRQVYVPFSYNQRTYTVHGTYLGGISTRQHKGHDIRAIAAVGGTPYQTKELATKVVKQVSRR